MSLQRYRLVEKNIQNLFNVVEPQELQPLKNTTISITGGGGFFGTWITELINYLNLNHNYNIHLNLIDREFDQLQSQAPHLLNHNVNLIRMDVRNLFEFTKETQYIIHAAGSPSSRDHITNPIDVMTTIAVGTEKVLKAAERLSDLRLFLNLSTGWISHHQSTAPSNIYVEAKRYGEALANSFRQQCRMPIATIRPFTFLGPYQPLQGPWALNNFISDVLSGNSIKVLGDGHTVRSYLYGSDAAYWLLKCLVRAEPGEVYNLGSPEGITLADLAKTIQSEANKVIDIIYCGSQASAKSNSLVPDTKDIENKIGVRPTVSLNEAINLTIQWYQLG